MPADSARVLREAQALLPALRRWRRRIHQQPELGWQERRTAALVARSLRAAGWRVTTGVAGTGVVGLLRGSKKGPTLAMRADMDALPVQEQSRASYASRVPGVMHACGHDGHIAMVLGAARMLARQQRRLAGNVKLIFQPCEEVPPGGAKAMIRAGVLQAPRVDAIIAGHVDTSLPVGTIGTRTGVTMAAADAFNLTVIGKGGHGALPHKSVDAIAVAGAVISGLQHVISRENDPLEPAVLTLGQVNGGQAYNIIAKEVKLRGTLRTLNARQRRDLPKRAKRLAEGICRAHRARCRFELEAGHPPLVNHHQMTGRVRRVAQSLLGSRQVRDLPRPVMSGEDFTYFADAIPACFFWVGAGTRQDRHRHPWHHPQFDFDERGLVAGTAVMVMTALEYLA